MVNEQTTITGEETPNISAEETPTGVKTTQDTAGEKLKKTLETINFINPLLQNKKIEDLTQENFPDYQKDTENILLQLLGHISFVKRSFTPENITKADRIKNNLSEPKRLCKLLEEYGIFLRYPNIPLSYKYVGSIAHTLKPIAEGIEENIHRQTNSLENKNKRFEYGKQYIDSIMSSIQEKMGKIEKINSAENNLYIKKTFSPYEESQKIFDIHKSNIVNKSIQRENTLPQNLSIESYQEIFEIVIDDLISNAIKFTPQGGTISIGTEHEYKQTISFFVKDTGIGIPKGVDVFSHTYTTSSLEGKQGTGAGLANDKLFIEMMGEKITHKDNIPHGTIFTFTMEKTPPQKDLQK